MKGETNKTIR